MEPDGGEPVIDAGVFCPPCRTAHNTKRTRDSVLSPEQLVEPHLLDAHAVAFDALGSVAQHLGGLDDVVGMDTSSVAIADCSTVLTDTANAMDSDQLPSSLVCCGKSCLSLGVLHDKQEIVALYQTARASRAAIKNAQPLDVPMAVRPGKKASRLALKSRTDVTRARAVKLLVDNNGASPRGARRFRLDFLADKVLLLRGEWVWCVTATMAVLDMTSKEMYSSHGPFHPPLIDILDLRVTRLRGNREARRLATFESIRSSLCCQNECCQDLPLQAIKSLWSKFEKCTTILQENDVIVSVLWCEALGRLSQLCQKYISAVTGISQGRYYKLLCLVQRYEGCVDLSDAQPHGNTGNVPQNITPISIVDKIVNVIDLYCRTDPTTNQLISCNENFAGVAGLLRALALEESSTYELICDTTVTRVIARVLRDRGLRGICMSSPDHNVCCICKVCTRTVALRACVTRSYFAHRRSLPTQELVGIINQTHVEKQRLSLDTAAAVAIGATGAPQTQPLCAPPPIGLPLQPPLGAPAPSPMPMPFGAPPPFRAPPPPQPLIFESPPPLFGAPPTPSDAPVSIG